MFNSKTLKIGEVVNMRKSFLVLTLSALFFIPAVSYAAEDNLIDDPSFEEPKDRDQFGFVWAKWRGWKYEGECDFRVGTIARHGKCSALLFGGNAPKIRIWAQKAFEPGRYKVTAYIRGLDIGTGVWNQTTEFNFNGTYIPLNKNGTFGWTPVTYVVDVKENKEILGPGFGLMAPGYLWIDDVSMVKVSEKDVELTPKPVLGQEEAPVAPPGEVKIGQGAMRCPECGYWNMPEWKMCYACGTSLETRETFTGEPVKLITSFEDKSPFDAGTVVEEHATDGTKSLRLDKSYSCMDGKQTWTGYDFLKADLFTAATAPMELYVEIRDDKTRDYWTRVNYNTVMPPGQSTFILPIRQLYVGEKSRPGRMLDKANVIRLVFSVGDNPPAPLFIDNVRLERDTSVEKVLFGGLYAFDFGTSTSPVLEGFTAVTPSTLYTKGRGYGLSKAQVWRAFDVLQPDPLYEDFICIEKGGIAVDVPNGKYRVFVNYDNPSGFWGEYQKYHERSILAEGAEVVKDTMDFNAFTRKYYRFWNVEDSPSDNTFDKYQKAYFSEKSFDVDVADGQLNIDFVGENWACSVSAVIIYPIEKREQGEKFMQYVQDRRRFYFDNYFKRILHTPTGEPLAPTAEDDGRGYVLFTRDFMDEIYYNDTPRKGEICTKLEGSAFAGEYEPLTLAVLPLKDLGRVAVTVSDLANGPDKIVSTSVDVGYVSFRISRVTMEGSVYTISPRLIMPRNAIDMPKSIVRRFWVTVKTPADAKPGLYKGELVIAPEQGTAAKLPIEFKVCKGTLDAVDIPAGPWSYTIDIPWYGDDPAVPPWNTMMADKSLRKLREYGFTSFSGMPVVSYNGFKDGQPQINFATGDAQMELAKKAGFTMPVVTYCDFGGLNLYYQDTGRMNEAGFKDYSEFIKAVFGAIQKHADEKQWLPVYWNLGDEPIGDDLTRSAENAEAYRKAFPKGPPFFTAATSFSGNNPDDPHCRLAKALHVADLNIHDEDSIGLIHKTGSDWAFYNGGNRWTFGQYMYKAAKDFGLKFRLSWHWNACAGDPYYALDCREDDYAWCNSSPAAELIPAIHFEQLREGLDDYRYMLTLARLAKTKAGTPEAQAAEELIRTRLAAFKLGQREHDELFPKADWKEFRARMAAAIEALR